MHNPTELAGRLAAQAAAVLADLPHRIHPAWSGALGADVAVLAHGGAGLLNTALQARFDLCWPDLSAARQALELAWLLPPDELRRLCAARELYTWRGTLARSVDAARRRSARALVGSSTFDALLSLPERRGAERALPALSADAVVMAGWALLERQLGWSDARSRRLIVLALPPAAPPGATWRNAAQGNQASACAGAGHAMALAAKPTAVQLADHPTDPTTDHAEFEVALPQLFPEHAWLFGSKPASLRSA